MKKSSFKLLTIMLCIIFALQLTPIIPGHIAKAITSISGEYEYTLSGNNATITDYLGLGGNIIIPSTIDGNSVIGIGPSAFAYLNILSSVTIPNSVTIISSTAFYSCTKLTTINVSIGNITYSSLNGVLYDKSATTLIRYPIAKTGLTFSIPTGVTSIGDYAFNLCSNLTNVTIPTGVTVIGQGAFSLCTSLINMNIPSTVTSIGISAFSSCSSLTSVTIPIGVTSIGEFAFYSCTQLISVTIPQGVTSIQRFTFDFCTSLTSVSIPNSVISIGWEAFSSCTSLTSVTIPSSVTSIDTYAFTLSGLTSVTIPANVAILGDGVFSGCANLTVADFLGNAPTTIGTDIFNRCAPTFRIQSLPDKTGFYNMTYLGNENTSGSVPVDSNSYLLGDTVTVLGNPGSLTKVGLYFCGWSTDANGFGYNSPSVLPLIIDTPNSTLYAMWSSTNYKVTFDSQSGSLVSDQTPNFVNLIIIPTTPTKPGYTFDGWYKEAICTTKWDFTADQVTSDTTLYAKWAPNLAVAFNSQGGSVVANTTAASNSLITPPTAPTMVNYNFGGWYKEAACTNAWDFNVDRVIADMTLYAKWTTNPIVTFNSQGGSGVTSIPAASNSLITPPTAPTMVNYTFGGWYKEAPCMHVWDFMVDTVTTDTTLYAKWTINILPPGPIFGFPGAISTFTFTFDSQGGSVVTKMTSDTNGIITAPVAPTKAGYTFANWYKEAGYINAWVFTTDKATADTTLYAKWTPGTSLANVQRLAGLNRIETSIAIAKHQYTDSAPDAVVLATANNFADALTGSGIAYKYNAPLLLVNKTVKDSKIVLDYITTLLGKNKNIYILGGVGAISKEISDYLTIQGYKIIRLGGVNRYETNQQIVNYLNSPIGTSIVIATGGNFADALSISSIADINGYPILLNTKDNLSASVSATITNIQPTTVYLIGGTGVLSANIETQVKKLNSKVTIVRLGGSNRYDTSMKIMEYFNLTTTTVAIATGLNFPDALSGSVLAARKNCSVLLVDNKDVTLQKSLLTKQKITDIIVFGGEGVISNSIAASLVAK